MGRIMYAAVAAADSQSPRETKIKERKTERKKERKRHRKKGEPVVTKFEARGGVTIYTIYNDLSAPAMKL